MHIFNMSTTGMQGFKKIHKKLWEELITQTLYRKAWRTDGRTDGQTGATLNAPWLSSQGHKKRKETQKKENIFKKPCLHILLWWGSRYFSNTAIPTDSSITSWVSGWGVNSDSTSHQQWGHTETGDRFKVSNKRPEKRMIDLAILDW